MANKPSSKSTKSSPSTRGKVKSDFPKNTLEEALRVPRILEEANGGRPLPPIETANALGMSPGSSDFRTLLSSSIKYGLTSGSYKQDKIVLLELGRKLVENTTHEEQAQALVEAALMPPTFRAIYDSYKGKKLPEKTFFEGGLVREFGVPKEHASKCVEVFNANMEKIGLIRVATTGRWLSTEAVLSSVPPHSLEASRGSREGHTNESEMPAPIPDSPISRTPPEPQIAKPLLVDNSLLLRRVFVAHGKNRVFLDPIKQLLGFGGFEPLVSVERPSVSQPIPDKVFNEMRICGAGIIHVDNEMILNDPEGKEVAVLNPNVLIEIGAAIALYGRRIILLVRDGVKLPSDLQGLFEVRYKGDLLDSDATIRLMKAINDYKNHPVPDRYPSS